MAHELENAPENRSRQEQILLMAAEGMTDKEIAARLGLSPETIGTYWRRILAKHSAASRTEVVAKVIRLQSDASMGRLADLNESLREVTDHLLWELSERETRPGTTGSDLHQTILNSLPEKIIQLDPEGFVVYTNAVHSNLDVPVGEPFEWIVDRGQLDDLREALADAFEGKCSRLDLNIGGRVFETCLANCQDGDDITVILSLRDKQ